MAKNNTAQYSDLRRYLVERLLELDPSLDDTVGARMFAVVIEPLLRRLGTDPMSTDLESFALDRLREAFPEYDVDTAGSAIRDLLVPPVVLLLEPLRREVEAARQQRSFADIDTLNTDEMDALLATLLVTRDGGTFSYGNVRLLFPEPRAVGIDASILFTTATGDRFVPTINKVFAASDFVRQGALWYFEVPVRSQNPGVSASAGDVRFVQNLDGVTRVTNLEAMSPATVADTNSSVLAKSGRLLTERTLVSRRAIERALSEALPGIVSTEVIGFGQAEMQRDVLRADFTALQDSGPGAVLHTTSNFRTLPIAYPAGEGAGAPAPALVPFTNVLRVVAPNAVALAAMQTAKYLRVLDGNGDAFDAQLLSRARRISACVVDGLDLLVQVDDFEVMPLPASVDADTVPGAITIADVDHFNDKAAQGSSYKLHAVDPDTGLDYPIGAPLPFVDVLTLAAGLPTTVATFGRDYLLVLSDTDNNDAFVNAVHTGATADKPTLPRQVRCYPLEEIAGANSVRIARTDAHMTDPAVYPYAGQAAYSFPEGASLSMQREQLRVIAFGAPSCEADTYDNGSWLDPWGKHSGAALTGAVAGAGADALACTVYLHASQPTWADMGVVAGQFIVLALGPTLVAPSLSPVVSSFFANMQWYGYGRIASIGTGANARRVSVSGLDWTTLYADVGGGVMAPGVTRDLTDVGVGHRLYWTVYAGQRPVITGAGSQMTSYDDAALAPAVRVALAHARRVSRRGVAPWGMQATGGFTGGATADTLTAYGSAPANRASGLWFRLNKSFCTTDHLLGGVPAARCLGVEVVDVEDATDALATIDTELVVISAATHALYSKARYETEFRATLRDGITRDVVPHHVSLPFIAGALASTDLRVRTAAVPEVVTTDFAWRNPYQTHGFLLPHPLGLDASSTWDPAYALTNQMLQFYAEKALTAGTTTLTLSGVPGGVPLPGALGATVPVNNNEIHVGGAVDVYLKPAASQPQTSEDIRLLEEDLLATTRVLASGSDMVLDDSKLNEVASPSLLGVLLARYALPNAGDTTQLDNLVLELVENNSAKPTAFRLLYNVDSASRVRIDGALVGVVGTLENVRWRLHDMCRTSLTAPLVVLQQGTDLIVHANELVATLPGGVNFALTTVAAQIILEILEGPSKGEYVVRQKFATQLALVAAPVADGTALPYKVFTRQVAGLQVPLVRVRDVLLADKDTGVQVPYRHPVDVQLSSIGGLNDDPVSDTDMLNVTLVAGAGNVANLVAATSFVTAGVLVRDVVQLTSLAEEFRYWYVVGFTDSAPGTNNVLVLNSTVPAGTSLLCTDYVVGRPAVGTATIVALQPTMLDFTQDTVFTYTAADKRVHKLRPTPDEYLVKLQPSDNTTDVTVTTGGARLWLDSAAGFFKHGVSANVGAKDVVEVLGKVLKSAAFSVVTREQLQVAGKVLVLTIDDVRRTVRLTGSNPMTLSDVAARINEQLPGLCHAAEANVVADYFLQIGSSKELVLLDEGSPGLLDELQYAAGDARHSSLPAGLTGDKQLDTLQYMTGTGVDRVLLVDSLPAGADGAQLFINIKQAGKQRLWPNDFVEQADGLFAATIKVSSYAPYQTDLIPQGSQVTVAGHYGLGWELVAANPEYTYSMGESLSIQTTPICLSPEATSLAQVYALPSAKVSVGYDRAEDVATAQQLLLSPQNRAACMNVLAKHFLPAYPVFSLQYSGPVSEEDVRVAISQMLTSLYPNRPLYVFELNARLSRMGVTRVRGPVEVAFLLHGKDRTLSMVRSKDAAAVPKHAHIMGDLNNVSVSRGAG